MPALTATNDTGAPTRKSRDPVRPASVLQAIAARLSAGENYYEIAAALGLPRAECRRRATEIAQALGLPEPLSPRKLFEEEVARRTDAGETIRQIADATGRDYAYVNNVRRSAGYTARRLLPMSPAEATEIQRLLISGLSNRAVARAIGCDPNVVADHRRKIAGQIPAAPASCSCGRALGHLGFCSFSPEQLDQVRRRLREGATITRIAAEMSVSREYLKMRVVDPILAELRADSVTCGCGRLVGHGGNCRARARAKRATPALPSPEPKRRPPVKVTREVYRDVFRRWHNGQSRTRIGEEVGVSTVTIAKLISYWRSHHHNRGRVHLCKCGRPDGHAGACTRSHQDHVTKRMQTRIDERIHEGATIRAIADDLRLAFETVARHSLAAREVRLARGQTCGCNRPIGHPGWCAAKWDAHEKPRGRQQFEPALEQRAIDALLTGRPVEELASELNVSAKALMKLRQVLPAEQSAQRRRAISSRHRLMKPEVSAAVRGKIEAAVSRGVDRALRADVIGELWLAVLEGRIEEGDIRKAARRFLSRAIKDWQNKFGPKSLDASFSADTTRGFGDLIGDDTTAGHLDEITIGGEQ